MSRAKARTCRASCRALPARSAPTQDAVCLAQEPQGLPLVACVSDGGRGRGWRRRSSTCPHLLLAMAHACVPPLRPCRAPVQVGGECRRLRAQTSHLSAEIAKHGERPHAGGAARSRSHAHLAAPTQPAAWVTAPLQRSAHCHARKQVQGAWESQGLPRLGTHLALVLILDPCTRQQDIAPV